MYLIYNMLAGEGIQIRRERPGAKRMGQLWLKFILSRVVQFLSNEIEYSEVVGDRMIECRSGDSCTIIGCRNYHHCASSYRGRRGHDGRSNQRESGRSRE